MVGPSLADHTIPSPYPRETRKRHKFTGREDDGTGLMYYRARYYQPRLQRFIAEDPLRFRGRDVNLFAYALNNPTNWTDASGTGPIGVGGALACAAIDILDAHDTFKRLGKLSGDINAINTIIRPLEERCSSSKGSDQDVERLRELKLEGLRKSAELTEGQLKGYIPNIALFFICAAIGLLPY